MLFAILFPIFHFLLIFQPLFGTPLWKLFSEENERIIEMIEGDKSSQNQTEAKRRMDDEGRAIEMYGFAYCAYARGGQRQMECLKGKVGGEWGVVLSAEGKCDDGGNLCGFLVARNGGRFVVAFRGTNTLNQLMAEAKRSTKRGCVPFDPRNEGQKGFVNEYFYGAIMEKWAQGQEMSIWEQILGALTELGGNLAFDSVIFTGHSLGGAFASLAALKMREYLDGGGVEIGHFSYGEPRVGCPKFAEYFNEQIPKSYRFVHGHDIVPHIPPAKNLCSKCNPGANELEDTFAHHGRQIQLNLPQKWPMANGDEIKIKWSKFLHFVDDHYKYFDLDIHQILPDNEFRKGAKLGKIGQDILTLLANCMRKNKKFGEESGKTTK